MIYLENTKLAISVLSTVLVGYYLPWIGKKILVYRKITIPTSQNSSLLLGGIASFIGGVMVMDMFFFWEIGLSLIFLVLLLLIGWVDWHTGYILDPLTIGGSLLIVTMQCIWNPSILPSRLGGSISIFLLFFFLAKVTKRMGQGDAKMLAMCALMMDWQSVLVAIWLASISGLVFVIILAVRKKIEIQKFAFPFGPHLAFGALSSYLYGEWVIRLFFL